MLFGTPPLKAQNDKICLKFGGTWPSLATGYACECALSILLKTFQSRGRFFTKVTFLSMTHSNQITLCVLHVNKRTLKTSFSNFSWLYQKCKIHHRH